MVTWRSLRDVPQRHCLSMVKKTIDFNRLLVRYREVKYQLKQSFFFTNIKFDELLSEIGNVLQKGEPYQHNTLKEFSFSYIHATPRKT